MIKIIKLIVVGCTRANPRAAPIKGAVQGDATTTARTPVANELEYD